MRFKLDPELSMEEMELFRFIYENAARELSERGSLNPIIVFRAGAMTSVPGLKEGQFAALRVDIPDHDHGKDILAAALRAFARKADATLAVVFFECWMVKPSAAESNYIQQSGEFLIRPSQHPQRLEIISISVSKPRHQNWSAWVEIKRDTSRTPSIPSEPPSLEYLKAAGRFANLLDDDDPPELNCVPSRN